jgi:chromosome segregation ATPase
MHADRTRSRARTLLCAAVLLSAAGASPAGAQQADRERAQMLQMQQQLQRLQSDNAAIQKERGELQTKAQEAEKLNKASTRELARSRQEAAVLTKDLAGVRGELSATHDRLSAAQAETDRLQKALDQAIALAAVEKQRNEAQQALLAARLKVQTARGDHCETRHEAAMKFGGALIDRYESDRLRVCEPVTGIWRVRNESQIQQLREELYGLRLDIPDPVPTAAAAPSADASTRRAAH